MAVTFGGWEPAPEPSVDARLALSILPQFANEYLRQQSPEGQADLLLRQQQVELAKQRLGLEREAAASEAALRTAQAGHLGAQTERLGAETERTRTMTPFEIDAARLGLLQGRAGLAETEAKTGRLKAETAAIPGEGLRDLLLKAQADEALARAGVAKQHAAAADLELGGKVDFESNVQSARGKMHARKVFADLAGKYNQAKAIQIKALNPKFNVLTGQYEQVPPELKAEADQIVAFLEPQMAEVAAYLGVKQQTPAVQKGEETFEIPSVKEIMGQTGAPQDQAEAFRAFALRDPSGLARLIKAGTSIKDIAKKFDEDTKKRKEAESEETNVGREQLLGGTPQQRLQMFVWGHPESKE